MSILAGVLLGALTVLAAVVVVGGLTVAVLRSVGDTQVRLSVEETKRSIAQGQAAVQAITAHQTTLSVYDERPPVRQVRSRRVRAINE